MFSECPSAFLLKKFAIINPGHSLLSSFTTEAQKAQNNPGRKISFTKGNVFLSFNIHIWQVLVIPGS